MSDERPEHPNRVDRVVQDLLKGRRLRVGPDDAGDREEIMMAAGLAGAREARPHMRAAFRHRLAGELAGDRHAGFPSRRVALVAGLGLAVGAATGVGLSQMGGHRTTASRTAAAPGATPHAQHTSQPAVIDPRNGRWVDVAAFDDLLEGQAQRVNLGAFSAFIVRQGDKAVGFSSICSHLPCELVWNSTDRVLLCPCHNQSFDLKGEPVRDNYPVPALVRVRVQVVKGVVQVLAP